MEIRFTAIYGEEEKEVLLEQREDMGEIDGYQITIDNYHYGVIVKRNGSWRCYGTKVEQLDTADQTALIDRVIEAESKK